MFWEYYVMGIILIPGIIFALIAQSKVNSSFNKWSTIQSACGLTGEQVARKILDENGLTNITIIRTNGTLTDYYDNKKQIIALSNGVANSSSIASIGVAMHEVGHALQYKNNYFPIKLRNFIIPITNFVSSMLWPLVIIGCLFNFWLIPNSIFGMVILWIAVVSFSLAVLFNLLTLPVEYNASKRALSVLQSNNILHDEELAGAKEVLNSAALTYVAALLVAILNLLRFVLVFFRNRDD